MASAGNHRYAKALVFEESSDYNSGESNTLVCQNGLLYFNGNQLSSTTGNQFDIFTANKVTRLSGANIQWASNLVILPTTEEISNVASAGQGFQSDGEFLYYNGIQISAFSNIYQDSQSLTSNSITPLGNTSFVVHSNLIVDNVMFANTQTVTIASKTLHFSNIDSPQITFNSTDFNIQPVSEGTNVQFLGALNGDGSDCNVNFVSSNTTNEVGTDVVNLKFKNKGHAGSDDTHHTVASIKAIQSTRFNTDHGGGSMTLTCRNPQNGTLTADEQNVMLHMNTQSSVANTIVIAPDTIARVGIMAGYTFSNTFQIGQDGKEHLSLNTTSNTLMLGRGSKILTASSVWFQGTGGDRVTVGSETEAGERSVVIGTSAGSSANIVSIGFGHTGSLSEGVIKIGSGIPSSAANAISIGKNTKGGIDGVSVGSNAGTTTSTAAIAIGLNSGEVGQGDYAISIGRNTARRSQGEKATAIGVGSGVSAQGSAAVSLGTYDDGQYDQGNHCVSIGSNAGSISQTSESIAIGRNAGDINQGAQGIAIGRYSGVTSQQSYAIAIGSTAGNIKQNTAAVSIGVEAGYQGQHANSIAIGIQSGKFNQHGNAIAIGMQAGFNLQNERGIAMGLNAGASNQGVEALAIGHGAGQSSQGTATIGIGSFAGFSKQQYAAISIGALAGGSSQNAYSIAIGYAAGQQYQAGNTVAIGELAGYNLQDAKAISIGYYAGKLSQNVNAISIGAYAGESYQDDNCVAIGPYAGQSSQNNHAIAIGMQAGKGGQGCNSIAIGRNAGYLVQSYEGNGIAIGYDAAYQNQDNNSIAIGTNAGREEQGPNSIAIGRDAGYSGQDRNTIVLNATAAPLNTSNTSAFYVKPVRISTDPSNTPTDSGGLQYDSGKGEIFYNTAKTFVIDHPDDKEKYLVHGCLEGPEGGVYYRGRGEVGTPVILPNYVPSLIKGEPTIQITPIYNGSVRTLNCSEYDIKTNSFEVFGTEGPFYWTFTAKRCDVNVEPLKAETSVNGNGPYLFTD